MKKDRFYYNSKRYVPSGTTVLPRPDLTQWGADCAVDYIEGWVYGDMPKGSKVIDLYRLDKARTAFLRESMEAADYGTYIHTMCQYSLENNLELESPHEMTDKFMKGLWEWKVKHKVKVIAMEQEVITDTYGGRLDLVCEMDAPKGYTTSDAVKILKSRYQGIKPRLITLVDFKTGKSSYYDTWKWQLAGYRQAWNKIYKGYSEPQIQTHGILKFNKKTLKVNYKSFDSYSATRTNPETKEKEKYTRTYETDRQTFNSLVANWWLVNRGIKI